MPSKEFSKIRERLVQEEKSLVGQLGMVGIKNPAVPGDFEPALPSYGDTEDETINESVDLDRNIAVEDTLERQLELVRSALAKIDQGTYGSCESCGSPIEEKRLAAMPTTARCIHCAKR